MPWLFIGLAIIGIIMFVSANYSQIKVAGGKGCSSCPSKNIPDEV